MKETCYHITLVCFNCGATKDIYVSKPPQFAFELADMANKAGMYGVLDMYHSRSLVFCNEKCSEQQKTKKGTFRLRPKIHK